MTVILVITLLVLGACASAPAAKQSNTYPAGTEMYPAIYGAFSELYPNAKYLDIDFYNDTYTLTGITGYALAVPISYDMTVRLTQTREIDVTYSDIYQMNPSTQVWNKTEAFGFYNFNKAASDISGRMSAIANDPAALDRFEKAAMADIKFVYAIMKNFTSLAFQDFIDKYAKGSIFKINGPIADVREVNEEINGKPYKYIVTLRERLAEESSSYFLSSRLSDYVYCRFYTNQDDVIRLSRNAVLSVQGTLVGASQGSSGVGAGLYLNLVDVR